MRRVVAFLSVFAVVLLGMAGVGASTRTVAQEATPAAGDMGMEGITFEPLGFAEGIELPSPADLLVVRFGLEPGAEFAFEASDPTGAMVVVQSGEFTIRVVEVDWSISRGAALQEAMASPEAAGDRSGMVEVVAMGAEGTLAAGDVAWVPGSVTGGVRNAGTERAEALLFLAAPAAAMSEATPAP